MVGSISAEFYPSAEFSLTRAVSMQVLLVSLGSMGDTWPFLALGKALQTRGHQVVLMANGFYRAQIEAEGLPFVENLSAEEFADYARRQSNWGFRESLDATAGLVLGQVRKTFDFLAERYVPGATVVAAQAYCMGARIAQEALGLPLATVHMQPLWFRSVYHSPVLPRACPTFVTRGLDRMTDYFVDAGLGPSINALRAEYGLAPARRLMKSWWNSPQLVVGFFPDWFDPPQPDWPPNVLTAGFPLLQWQGQERLSDELEQFLTGRRPPIVFTQTASTQQVSHYFAVAAEVASRLERPAIFLTPHDWLVPQPLPEHIRHYTFVPLDALLPRACAHVHHGGMGTIALSLLAGIPQITVPMVNDQNDNSRRLARLGVSACLTAKEFQPVRAAAELTRLLDSREVAVRCRDFARRTRESDAVGVACDALERLQGQDTPARCRVRSVTP